MKINFEDLLGLTIGELYAMTTEFLRQNPDFKTAEQILNERNAEKAISDECLN